MIRLFSLPDGLEADYGFKSSADKNAYLEMIRPVSGMVTEEKEAKITEMKKLLIEARSIATRLDAAYRNDDQEQISILSEQIKEYAGVFEIGDVIDRIFDQYNYATMDREKRAIIPVENVGVMKNDSINYPFLLCICFCFAFAVMVEQNGKAHLIIRTTPNGQGKTMTAKLGVLFLSVTVSSAVLSLADFITLSFQLPYEYWQYNICSLEQYRNCPVEISIFGVFIWVQLFRLLGALFIGMAAMLTAYFTRNYAASIFPYAALPIVADYVAENDSQSYFLPTGLLKGWGYFYGDITFDDFVADIDVLYIFHNVPIKYTVCLVIFTLLFVIAAAIILISGGRNRLTRKRGGIKKLATVSAALMILPLSSCSDTGSVGSVVEEFGGSISPYGYNVENSKYKFSVRKKSYVDDRGRDSETYSLLMTDKETKKRVEYPPDVFGEPCFIYEYSIFVTENFLLYQTELSTMKLDLNDFSLTTVYKYGDTKKILFGLIYGLDDSIDYSFSPEGAFSDGETIYIYDKRSGIARVEPDGGLTFVATDDTSSGIEFDGKSIYYIAHDSVLHKCDVRSGKNTVIYDGDAAPYTLSADWDYLYFKSDGKDMKLDKATLEVSVV